MKRAWWTSMKVLAGVLATALYAMPQSYTISAKPGVVNYIEGTAYLNGSPISAQNLKTTFLNANDVLSTDLGKAEVLLTPGVFLRVGNNTQVRMLSPSLADPELELKSGEAMIEVDDLVKDNHITLLNHGGTVTIEKPGLYRLAADPTPVAAVLEGKAQVTVGDRKTEIGKGHEVAMEEVLKSEKFDTKKQDDLYAWSNVRSEYDAASSYQAAKNISVNSFGGGGGWGNYGYGGMYSPGWLWNSGLNSWAWLPTDGAFYSPFGYGFYGPGLVAYAPVVYGSNRYYGGGGGGGTTTVPVKAAIPVNPKAPPAIGTVVTSPAAAQAARSQAARSFASSGFSTANGMHVSAGQATAMTAPARTGGGPVAAAGASGGGAPGRASGGFTAASGGGGHSAAPSSGAAHH